MHPFHIVVSVANILFGLMFALLLLAEPSAPHPVLAGLSEFGGYFSNALAILVSCVVAVVLMARLGLGGARPFLRRHWLGLFNGAFVIVCWFLFFGIAKLAAV